MKSKTRNYQDGGSILLMMVILLFVSISFLLVIWTDDVDFFQENFSVWNEIEENHSIINFQDKNTPSIIVDENMIEMMPQAWLALEKNEINKQNYSFTPPKEINLRVPFYSQASDADWSLPWKEACEEASIALAYYFVQWRTLTKEQFKDDILGMVELQKQLFWKYIDTSIAETAILLEEFYNYHNYEIIENPTLDDLKYHLARWHPIVAPFSGKKLWNSFFTSGGPRYHMLVIVWYNDTFFFTNDVGTSRWENFAYSYETILNALHDLIPLGEGDILTWEKRVLVLK